MNPIKQHLTQHLEDQMQTIEVDAVLKQKLYEQLSHQSPSSVRRWWKVLLPIFSITTLAVFVIILSVNKAPSTNSVATIINKTILPQQALAAALEQVFTLDTFNSTLGLVESDELHHRSFTYQAYPSTLLEQATADMVMAHTMDLWTLKQNMKFKVTYQHANSKKTESDTVLFNADTQTMCDDHEKCHALSALQQQAQARLLSDQGAFYPIASEPMATDISLESFMDELNGPGVYVTWATPTPITHGQFMSTSNFSDDMTGNAITDYTSHSMHWFTNDFHDNQYWHRMPLYQNITNLTDSAYFQIQEVNNTDFFGVPDPATPTSLRRASMIYHVNFTNQTIVPVTPDEAATAINNAVLSNSLVKSLFNRSVQPALYLMRHANDFSDPLNSGSITKHDLPVFKIEYPLPDSYMAEVQNLYSGPHDTTANYLITMYLDATQSKFLGYEVTENDTVLESLWLSDEVLPSDQAASVFATTN